MAVFPAIYRAKTVSVNGSSVQAYVPQVFGEVEITIDAFLGGMPSAATMGWVQFQGGNPEFPVWAGNLGEGGTPAEVDLSGADEVWIGTGVPAGNQELWFDTDAIAPPLSVVDVSGAPRGLVGSVFSAGNVSCPISTLTYVTGFIPITLLVGRKYKLSWSFRAVGRTDAAELPVNTNLVLYDNTTTLQSWVDFWYQYRGNWGNLTGWSVVSGDGVARQLRLGISNPATAALTIYPTAFIVEDIGV